MVITVESICTGGFPLDIVVSEWPVGDSVMQFWQASLSQLGIHATIRDIPNATYFQVTGVNRAGGFDGVPLNAVNPNTPKTVEKTIAVNVLDEKPIKIAIRAVLIKDDDGKWVSHGKVAFDPEALRDQMNMVWVPQANVKFSLVATDPLKINEKELADEVKPELFELRHLAIGKKAPDVEGEDFDGKKFKLSEYRGKVVVLDFWGNW